MLTLANHADTVIIGSRGGRYPSRTGLLGTPLAKRSPAPVVVTPPDSAAKPDGEVLAGSTTDIEAHAVLAFAFEHARRHGASVRVICRLPERRMTYQETEAWLFDATWVWQNVYPDVRLTASLVAARPTARLIVDSAHARLLVIGDRGRRGTDWALRHRLRQFLRWTGRPVAVVPAAPGEQIPSSD